MFSDAIESVSWYEPPPVGTATDPTEDLTHSIRLVEGSINEPLSWNFSLIDLTLLSLTLKLGDATAARIIPSADATEVDGSFTSRFSLSWIPQNVTLNIFSVTTADEGVFTCELFVRPTRGGNTQTWKRNIKVTVVGKLITI